MPENRLKKAKRRLRLNIPYTVMIFTIMRKGILQHFIILVIR